MDDKSLITLREEFDSRRIKRAEFAREKQMEYWKMCYALRKGLRLKNEGKGVEISKSSAVGFKKVKTLAVVSNHEKTNHQLVIKTPNGVEVIIPL